MDAQTEQNVLIDTFFTGRIRIGKHMGRKRGTPGYENYYDTVEIKKLKYDTSWDLLLPVYRKAKDFLGTIPRPSNNHCCKGDALEVDVHCALMSIDIENTFKYLAILIEWINLNQQPKQ